ncbi:MAG: hypothetical protein WD431_24535 [Cyclobacteriaceae bacterium]
MMTTASLAKMDNPETVAKAAIEGLFKAEINDWLIVEKRNTVFSKYFFMGERLFQNTIYFFICCSIRLLTSFVLIPW